MLLFAQTSENKKSFQQAIFLYVFFSMSVAVIVAVSNLIFMKYVNFNPIGMFPIELSVGILFYPITFLITDLITEFYGRHYAFMSVLISFITSLLVLILIYIGIMLPATEWSPINDEIFQRVFDVYGIGLAASYVAYLSSQFCDILLFSWIKRLSKGKYLWLRNNVSTIFSQAVDTFIVVSILGFFEIIPTENLQAVYVSSYTFKFVAALLDTPFCYLGHYCIRSYFKR